MDKYLLVHTYPGDVGTESVDLESLGGVGEQRDQEELLVSGDAARWKAFAS